MKVGWLGASRSRPAPMACNTRYGYGRVPVSLAYLLYISKVDVGGSGVQEAVWSVSLGPRGFDQNGGTAAGAWIS